jgi:hypothetical protein
MGVMESATKLPRSKSAQQVLYDKERYWEQAVLLETEKYTRILRLAGLHWLSGCGTSVPSNASLTESISRNQDQYYRVCGRRTCGDTFGLKPHMKSPFDLCLKRGKKCHFRFNPWVEI